MSFTATHLALSLALVLPSGTTPGDLIPPAVPAALTVPAGHTAFLAARAEGTQNYTCLVSATGIRWTFFGPQATLFSSEGEQVMTHFLSPNAAGNGLARPTWQHSGDTSAVWGELIASSSDPTFVEAGAIPWLLLRVVGAQYGPGSGDTVTNAKFIHRVNTIGGVVPATGCSRATDVGKKALVPYTSDYILYR